MVLDESAGAIAVDVAKVNNATAIVDEIEAAVTTEEAPMAGKRAAAAVLVVAPAKDAVALLMAAELELEEDIISLMKKKLQD